jgi:sugar phosphate isomerase/epimerase
MTLSPVSISLSSYGADYVRSRGQASFIELLATAGASHIELREELDLPADKSTLAAAIRAGGLQCVYSSPLELWSADGQLARHALADALANAQACGASQLKVSLGHYHASGLADLHACLMNQPVRLLVENDQTPQGGCIAPLLAFFSAARHEPLPIGMTFDIGNWQWQSQSVVAALNQLGPFVEYVHCKGVQLNPAGKRVASAPTPLDLDLWEQLLQRLSPGVLRAIEFPLQGDDLAAVTRLQVANLARLGQARAAQSLQEKAHV